MSRLKAIVYLKINVLFQTCDYFFSPMVHKCLWGKFCFVHMMKVNGVQCCFGPHWLQLVGQKLFKDSLKERNVFSFSSMKIVNSGIIQNISVLWWGLLTSMYLLSSTDEETCVFKCSVSRETECSRVGKQSFIITLGCNSVLLQFASPAGKIRRLLQAHQPLQ